MPTQAPPSHTVSAAVAATAWLNAFLASGSDENRPALNRTLSVELFAEGVQFVGCDGTVLLRTWAPFDGAKDVVPMPEADEAPDDSVVVIDTDGFASAFMRTLRAAASDEDNYVPFSMSIEDAEPGDLPLGAEFVPRVLVLRAAGQTLKCKLYESEFPAWRSLKFGIEPAELVTGMTLAVRLFAVVGKLKDVTGVDCTFHGEDRSIELRSKFGSAPIHGLLMPMRRSKDAGE